VASFASFVVYSRENVLLRLADLNNNLAETNKTPGGWAATLLMCLRRSFEAPLGPLFFGWPLPPRHLHVGIP
jgi:hypothetical protein